MNRYRQLNYSDLVRIETLLNEGYKKMDIAIKLSRSKSTISRCLKNNIDDDGIFRAESAWEKICIRKRNTNSHPRIISDSLLEKYILEKIETYWTPEQIAGRWKHETGEPLCHETIYQYIYKYKPELVKVYFRRKGKKYQHNRREKYQIDDRRSIDQRPKEVEERKHIGHWEGDTIIGKNHKQAIATNVERKSGLLLAGKLERKTAESIVDITEDLFSEIPDDLKISITYDNGREFAWHRIIESNNKITVYFARPYSSWQRGTSENTNGLLRQFIPKKTDFSQVSEKELEHYVNLINNRPRKRHNWLTPLEVFNEELKKLQLGIESKKF